MISLAIDTIKVIILIVVPILIAFFTFYLNHINASSWFMRKYMHTAGLTIAAFYGGLIQDIDEIIIILISLIIILILLTIPKKIRLYYRFIDLGKRDEENQIEVFLNLTITTAVAVILLLLFINSRQIFMAGIFSVAFGDALGEFIGRPYGKHKYKIFRPKSVEGSFGVFFGTFVGCVVAFTIFNLFNFNLVLIFIIVSVISMIVEALSFKFIDNIILPFIVAFSLYLLI